MEFTDGTSVFTYDNKNAGKLRRVVIDPQTDEVTHIVIEKGLLLKDDKVVPVDKVAFSTPYRIDLTCTAEELSTLFPMEIAHTVPLHEAASEERIYLPMPGGMYVSPPPQPTTVTEVTRTIPDNLVALKEGSPVMTGDDQHAGDVEKVLTSSTTGRVTGFIISHGLLFKQRKSIPIEWVKSIDPDEVVLIYAMKQVDELPDMQK